MDTANVTSIDSDSLICELHDDITHQLNTPEDASHQLPLGEGSRTGREKENSLSKMCYGPELTIDINSAPEVSILSTFVEDIESKLQSPYKTCHAVRNLGNKVKGNKFESASSLDIEKELNDLMGTLCSDLERKGSKRLSNTSKVSNVWESCDDSANGSDRAGGSKINLAFDSEDGSLDDDGPARTTLPDMDNYWANQRMKSTSFSDRYKLGKLMRMGRQRMSMIELRNKVRKSSDYENIRSDFGNPKGFVRCTGSSQEVDYKTDRSAAKMLSNVSLPPVLQSGEESIMKASTDRDMADDPTSQVLGERDEVLSSSRSPSISKQLNDSIDWSWMEEAMNSLNTEYQEPSLERSSSLRVDAGCQTQLDQSWRGEEERMRSRSSSPRVDDSAIGVNNECRIVETRSSSKDMPSKPFVEGGGTSRCSSWLRQSMRRIRHFDLEDPSRIRSAPPDGLRVRSESDSEPTVNSQSAIVNRLTVGNDSQQVLRSGINDIRRTLRSSFSLPRRGAGEGSEVPQQQQQQQEQLHLESETASSSPTTENLDNLGYESDSTDRHPLPRTRRSREDEDAEDAEGLNPLGSWPHGLSSVFAGLGCTLGLFNISRFSVLSVHFGSNFIIQFLILSLILGIPLLAFHAALGQTLGAGPVDMWKISPLFQGIGVALLLAQALIGMYSIVGVSWMFVYFRDSFITKQDTFRWAESFRHYHRPDNIFGTSIFNASGRLEETVPDYLNIVVLQRHGLTSPVNAFGHLKFQLTFNLAVVWMIVFVSLSKGLRSYGKVVYVFSVLPVFGVLIISSKLLGLTSINRGLFPQTEWSEFFLNAKSWISAGTEVMLTWNLLGVAIMQVTSHNRSSRKLWRDVAAIILLTLVVLILAAFLGNLCHQLISIKGYSYVPSSFERVSTYSFLQPTGGLHVYSYGMPVRHLSHASLMAGERVGKPEALHESGYQVLRLATELVPATLAILDGNYLSPFWAVLFYFTLILFGIAQQLAIWHCVITGIMAINAPVLKSWETTITFFTCAAGFILGLPMTTELGIFVVYFLDYCLGGGWWVVLLTLMEICAILMIRGRPYSGENISIALFGKSSNCSSLWAVPLLTFTWNVILPVALLVMSITIFKNGGYRDLWIWKCGKGDYWPLWTREVGVFVQMIPLLCIPVIGLVQCYRYLSKGPADIFDRLANLYRPATNIRGIGEEDSHIIASNLSPIDSGVNNTTELPVAEDPPPKYTPPPSYSTATGIRIAKLLRQSFRRSVRRIQTVLGPEVLQPPRPPPPDYDSVLVEINGSRSNARNGNSVSSPPPSSETNTLTAADVAQILRCSFRRTNTLNPQQPLNAAINNTNSQSDEPSTNLVISSPGNE